LGGLQTAPAQLRAQPPRPRCWSQDSIGSGAILHRTVTAIEIADARANLTNNLVFWQNRFGHANREHCALLDASANAGQRREIEQLLFTLYRNSGDEGMIFQRLSDFTGAKYPLLGYLYYLKNADRFMPIQPTTFDRAFRDLGMDLVTLRHCSWENYQLYLSALAEIRQALSGLPELSKVRLIDAHSFCWLLVKLEDEGPQGKDHGRIVGSRETSIIAMRVSIEDTVRNSNGQIAQRTIKNKELRMTSEALQKLLTDLMDKQNNRCALTGIPFHFHGPHADKNLLPSADRIDSIRHYEPDNIQLICQFINFWKSDADNDEFKRLLMLVRG
jgi:hypothetical protein